MQCTYFSFLFLIYVWSCESAVFALSLWCMECKIDVEKSNNKQFNIRLQHNKTWNKWKGYEYFRKALYIYINYLVLCFIFLHCPLSGPVLIYISLLIISCIMSMWRIKEPWTLIYECKLIAMTVLTCWYVIAGFTEMCLLLVLDDCIFHMDFSLLKIYCSLAGCAQWECVWLADTCDFPSIARLTLWALENL